MTKVFLLLWIHFAGTPFDPPQRIEMPSMSACQNVMEQKMAEASKDKEVEEATVSYMAGCMVEHVGGKPA